MSTKLTLKQFRELERSKKNAKNKSKNPKALTLKLTNKPTVGKTVYLGSSARAATPGPQSRSTGRKDGSQVFRHRECAGDLVLHFTDGRFQVVFDQLLTPSNRFIVPWLSRQAKGYETYTWKKMRIIVEPILPATKVGAIYMAVDYDCVDQPPSNKIKMMSYKDARRCLIWEQQSMTLDPLDLQKIKIRYLSNNGMDPDGGTEDMRLNAAARLFIAVDNIDPSIASTLTSIAEVYFEYECEMQTPQTSGDQSWSYESTVTNPTPGQPFANSSVSFGDAAHIAGQSIVSFDVPGRYLLECELGRATTATTVATTVSVSTLNTGTGLILGRYTGAGFTNGTSQMSSWVLQVNRAPFLLNFDATPTGTGNLNVFRLSLAGYDLPAAAFL